MAAANKRKKKRKKYLKLRKNGIWHSLVMFLIVSAVAALLLAVFIVSVLYFSVDKGITSEYETAWKMAELYRNVTDERDRYLSFDIMDTDYYITDSEGRVVHSKGKNTCEKEGYLYAIALEGTFDEDGRLLESPDGVSTVLHRDTEEPVLGGYEDSGIYIDFKSLFGKILDIFYTNTGKGETDEDVQMELPVWEEVDLGSGRTLFFKAKVAFKGTNLVFFVVMFLVSGALFAILLLVMIISTISKAINSHRVNKLFFTDMQTKGHNWLWFLLRSEQTLRRIMNAKKSYALIDLELAGFRRYCVCHSVDDGEARLVETNNALCAMLGKKELCAHSSEHRFALLLEYADRDALQRRIDSMLSGLGGIGAHGFAFHAGVFLIPPAERGGFLGRRKDVDIESDYNNACSARATLEDRSESAAAFFEDKLVEDQKWEATVTELQQRALAGQEFVVYYQPKYDPRTGELRGAEALIRWQSPEHGFITPYKFIPIFEKNGFITEIDHYMIQHVARDQRRWLDMGYRCVPVSVNVSRAHFIEPDLAEQIRDMIDREGTPHSLIEIELTESAFFDDKNAMINTITKLKQYGFAVSMDDFGSGYSSLNSLKDMPLDVLKLDAEFFRGEAAGTDRGEIVVSEAIKLAKSLNMRTVAEGVEIKDQVDFLAAQGCDMIQGYYFAKPMPAQDYEERMKNGRAEGAEA